MKEEKEKMATPGWKPANDEERKAVIKRCIEMGMSRKEAEKFVRYNAVRRWACCENGSVEDAANEWIAAAERAGEPLDADGRLEELSKEVIELREAVEGLAETVRVECGNQGKADIWRILGEAFADRQFVEEAEKIHRRWILDLCCAFIKRHGVDAVKGLEPGGERVGGEGV